MTTVREGFAPDPLNEKSGPKTELYHRDGVPWFDATKPRRFHRHTVQTYAYVDYFTLIERCACGATRIDGRSRWRKS
jgi:hypothetical protein